MWELSEEMKEGDLDSGENVEAFLNACSFGNYEECEKLIRNGWKLNFQYIHGQTGLMVATQYGQLEIVRLLLANGADPQLMDVWGYIALMKAAACGHTAIFRALLKNSNSLSCSTVLGKLTALTEAAANGRTEIVKLCLEHDEQERIIDTPVELTGMTPLMLAVAGGHYNTVEILLENGADMSLRNSSSQTAMEIAAQHMGGNILSLLNSYVSHTSPRIPVLTITCTDGDDQYIDDINTKDKFNMTPTSRLPLQHTARQAQISGIIQHVTRRSKSCDNPKRKKASSSIKTEGIFHYILQSAGLEQFWPLFKDQEVDLKLFFTLKEDDFLSIGIHNEDVLNKLLDISHHYKSLFNL